MALTPAIVSIVALARDPAAALDAQPAPLSSVDPDINAAHPLQKRSRRAVLLGDGIECAAREKPPVAALLRGSIGGNLH
jgi:hypothetical protein